MRLRNLAGGLGLLGLLAGPGCDNVEFGDFVPIDGTETLEPGIVAALSEFTRTVLFADSTGYLALLTDDFVYKGPIQFSWAGGNDWGRADEAIIAGRFSDPSWVGFQHSTPLIRSQFAFDDLHDYSISDSVAVVEADFDLNFGASVPDPQFLMTFRQQESGEWLISRIEEGTSTWTRLRGAFHTEPNLADPSLLPLLLEDVFSRRDVGLYDKLLVPDSAVPEFRFHPREDDRAEMPWLTGESWSRNEELAMMDLLLAGAPTSDGLLLSLNLDVFPDAVQFEPDGRLVSGSIRLRIRREVGGQRSIETDFTLRLVADAEGDYRIQEIWESSPAGWEQDDSWGLAKNRVRAGPEAR